MDDKEKLLDSNSNDQSKSLNVDLNLPTDFVFDLIVIPDDEGELSQEEMMDLYIREMIRIWIPRY